MFDNNVQCSRCANKEFKVKNYTAFFSQLAIGSFYKWMHKINGTFIHSFIQLFLFNLFMAKHTSQVKFSYKSNRLSYCNSPELCYHGVKNCGSMKVPFISLFLDIISPQLAVCVIPLNKQTSLEPVFIPCQHTVKERA